MAFQLCAARPKSAEMLRRSSQNNLVASSSLGKCLRDLMILRGYALMLSIALVVYITRRTAGVNTKNGMV